jgi:uncharacterized protein
VRHDVDADVPEIAGVSAARPADPHAPAVAVMAKVPGVTTVKSRLHACLTPEQATELYRCFLLDRLDALCRVPRVHRAVAFTPPEARAKLAALVPAGFQLVAQSGGDLGERLFNVVSGLLTEGHAAAIAIDSDSPTLPMGYVQQAARRLETGAADVVLGPCEDGGYYLIGVRSAERPLFESIPWSTDRVLELTIARARAAALRVHLLPAWFDVDTEADLRRLHTELKGGGGAAARTAAMVAEIYR